MTPPRRARAALLTAALLLPSARPALSQGIKGSMTEEQLNDKWW